MIVDVEKYCRNQNKLTNPSTTFLPWNNITIFVCSVSITVIGILLKSGCNNIVAIEVVKCGWRLFLKIDDSWSKYKLILL
jgi:hypothetical protein